MAEQARADYAEQVRAQVFPGYPLNSLPKKRVEMLRIDVEGFELPVFEGRAWIDRA